MTGTTHFCLRYPERVSNSTSDWNSRCILHQDFIRLPFQRSVKQMKCSVLQLSPSFYPQNRSSFPKSVLAEFCGLETYEKSMETDESSIQRCETVIEAAKNILWLGVVDAVLWRFTGSSSFKTIWISHEFWVHGIQLVLISWMNFYFVDRKEKIIELQTI
jgi:hypothetical protein